MAKMFYTLEEAAEVLGVEADQVKEMASEGKLQQFRDRDKLMFKRDQVDQLAGGGSGGGGAAASSEDTDAPIPLAGDTDAIDLKADDTGAGQTVGGQTGTGGEEGQDVFEPGEVSSADSSAQTQVTQSMGEDELSLESVGSGSGLLDLTRESDDTSLGAELLDEISPGESGTGAPAAQPGGSSIGGTLEGDDSGTGGPDVVGAAEPASEPVAAAAPGEMSMGYQTAVAAEPDDPAGSGFGAGMLLGATAALVIGLFVATAAVTGVSSPLTAMMTESPVHYWGWAGGLLVGSIVLGVIGLALGTAAGRRG